MSLLVARLALLFNIAVLAATRGAIASEGGRHVFSKALDPEDLVPHKEKLTHLHFYFHDVVTGPNTTAIRVAEAPTTNNSATSFGAVVVFDNRLTVDHDIGSRLVGRAQGTYTLASQEEFGLLMVFDCVFLEGKYNGSSINIMGRNSVFAKVREMPVVGGSGVFRLARGYAQAQTYAFDMKTGLTIVEYDVYVFHY
ncbi:hypothetical protein MLD38_035605 [Melastoma candidum]|uniref:Uncharacterized protein n=1 Tax=Melastoma candidum TaxID=119954 RepID=A0ACB9LHI8_9MYRT|nr:hypothetical protein MLD38_035605 [Melastoma candidum]